MRKMLGAGAVGEAAVASALAKLDLQHTPIADL